MSKFGFDRAIKNMDRMKRNLPVLLANQAQTFFVESWKKQGWDDNGVKAWPERKDKGPKSQGRAILVKSGKLRRAVGQSIRSKTFSLIKLVVALPYAAVHNDGYNGTRRAHKRSTFAAMRTKQFIGLARKKKRKQPLTTYHVRTGDVSVKAHTMNMPRRRFMGDSKTLRTKQRTLIDKELQKLWQG